jgi:hypothetical protein
MMATRTVIPGLLPQPTSAAPSAIVSPTQDVTVEVSGSRFCIVPSLFKKVEKLAWYEHRNTLHLNASPDVFEILLQYFLFNSLPDIPSLPGHELSELELLVKPLPKTESLIEHIKTGRTASRGTTSTSLFMRSLPSLTYGKTRKKEGHDEDNNEASVQEETVYPFAISPTNPEVQAEVPPIQPTYSTESDTTFQPQLYHNVSDDAASLTTPPEQSEKTSPEQSEKTSEKCRRVWRNMINSTKKGPRLRKRHTHVEWCAEFDFIL